MTTPLPRPVAVPSRSGIARQLYAAKPSARADPADGRTPPRPAPHGPLAGTTAQALLDLLAPAFDRALVRAVLQTLGHDLDSPRPLARQDIDAAVAAAEAGRAAMSGVSFLSRVLLSAEGNGAAFRACVAAAGVDPGTLSDDTRARIDGAFALEMAAADSRRHGVDLRAARPLMRRAIESALSRSG